VALVMVTLAVAGAAAEMLQVAGLPVAFDS